MKQRLDAVVGQRRGSAHERGSVVLAAALVHAVEREQVEMHVQVQRGAEVLEEGDGAGLRHLVGVGHLLLVRGELVDEGRQRLRFQCGRTGRTFSPVQVARMVGNPQY